MFKIEKYAPLKYAVEINGIHAKILILILMFCSFILGYWI